MGHLVAVGIEVEAPVVARSGKAALGEADPALEIVAVAHVPVEGGLDPDPPRIALAVHAPAPHLAPDVDDVVLGPETLDQTGQQVHRIALCHGVEIQLHARVRLDQTAVFDVHLVAPHEGEERIEIRVRLGLFPGKAPRLDQRLDRHVVAPVAQRPDAVRKVQVEGDMPVDRIRFVAVQPAQQRPLVENRHRSLRLPVEIHDRPIEFLRRGVPHVRHHVQRRSEHHPVDGRIFRTLRTPREQNRRGCGNKAGDSSLSHNFHAFKHKNTIFRANFSFFHPKDKEFLTFHS